MYELHKSITRLSALTNKYARLLALYRSAIVVHEENLDWPPKATSIFMSVPHYNRIFLQIHKWHSFGIYDFAKEQFMLAFIRISDLYESYILARFITHFISTGYEREEVRKCFYPVSVRWQYKNTRFANTFSFSKDQTKITLYYQPVIFDKDRSDVNGIALYRNNSISVSDQNNDAGITGGHYYVPDFVLKVEKSGMTWYSIFDAKFSEYATVRRYHVKDLAFKYLFSLSPSADNVSLLGLGILFGKCKPEDQIESAYDNQLQNRPILPFVDLLPMMEEGEEKRPIDTMEFILKRAQA